MLLAEYHLRRLAYKKAQIHYQIALDSTDSICKLGTIGVPKGQDPSEYLKICKFHSKILNLKLATVRAHQAVDKGQVQKTSQNPEAITQLIHSLAHISQYASNNEIMDSTEISLNLARYLQVCNFKPLTHLMYQKVLNSSMDTSKYNVNPYMAAAPTVTDNRDDAIRYLSSVYESAGANEISRRLKFQYTSTPIHTSPPQPAVRSKPSTQTASSQSFQEEPSTQKSKRSHKKKDQAKT
jgi:hypothetical protein